MNYKIEELITKNNQKTIKINNIFLHSLYNPEKEAERFVENLSFNKKDIIIIVEPGLSYEIPFLKKKFNDNKTGVLRFLPDFESKNSDYDFSIKFYSDYSLENQLFSLFSEEEILNLQFVIWQPSSKIFTDEIQNLIKQLKNILEKCKTLLITREVFEKKWVLNTVNFIKFSQNFFLINKINVPVLVVASGPSLKNKIEIIKKNQNKFFIICLSSAINVLKKYEIKPDLYFTTDGGYYAGRHLLKILKDSVPLACPVEAYIQKKILNTKLILPLIYKDGISKDLAKNTNIQFFTGERNGTISGTALVFATTLTSNSIYFAGLDLSASKGFQHTQPNIFDLEAAAIENRINNREKRSVKSQFNSQSLKIYEDWFKNQNYKENKVYRIINKNEKSNNLGKIIDIDKNQFEKICDTLTEIEKNSLIKQNYIKNKNAVKILKNNFDELKQSEKWEKQLFPIEYNSKDENLKLKLKEKNHKLINKIQDILNE